MTKNVKFSPNFCSRIVVLCLFPADFNEFFVYFFKIYLNSFLNLLKFFFKCYDLEEKARYRELLQSLNVNVDGFRRSSVDSLVSTSTSASCNLEHSSNRPTTSFQQIGTTLSELKRLQNSINYSTSFSPSNRYVSTPNRFSQTYSMRSNVDRIKSAYFYAKNSLEKLDQINSPKNTDNPQESGFLPKSYTPDVISLDGEDILANFG